MRRLTGLKLQGSISSWVWHHQKAVFTSWVKLNYEQQQHKLITMYKLKCTSRL